MISIDSQTSISCLLGMHILFWFDDSIYLGPLFEVIMLKLSTSTQITYRDIKVYLTQEEAGLPLPKELEGGGDMSESTEDTPGEHTVEISGSQGTQNGAETEQTGSGLFTSAPWLVNDTEVSRRDRRRRMEPQGSPTSEGLLKKVKSEQPDESQNGSSKGGHQTVTEDILLEWLSTRNGVSPVM
jgi:hypothetical protein